MTVEHPRKTIRGRVVTLLKAANTDAADNVFSGRITPIPVRQLPAIAVYTPHERSSQPNVGDGGLTRDVSLVIELHTKATDGLDDVADDFAVQVENAMAVNIKGVMKKHLAETVIALSGEGQDRTGLVRLRYEVNYRSSAIIA